MRIVAGDESDDLWLYATVIDTETGQLIEGCREVNTETCEIVRFDLDWLPLSDVKFIREIRQFKIIDSRTGAEIARTRDAFSFAGHGAENDHNS